MRGADASSTVCGAVCQILARRNTLLPLPPEQKEILAGLDRMLPEDFVLGCVHVRAEPEITSWSVVARNVSWCTGKYGSGTSVKRPVSGREVQHAL